MISPSQCLSTQGDGERMLYGDAPDLITSIIFFSLECTIPMLFTVVRSGGTLRIFRARLPFPLFGQEILT